MPVKKVNGAIIYVRDVAQVRDGFARSKISSGATACAARS